MGPGFYGRRLKAEGRRQKAEGKKKRQKVFSFCLLPSAFCLLLFGDSIETLRLALQRER